MSKLKAFRLISFMRREKVDDSIIQMALFISHHDIWELGSIEDCDTKLVDKVIECIIEDKPNGKA